MISVSGLTISRGERVLFRDLSFSVRAGEVLALTGANGAGKTSLMRTLAGFIRPDAGEVAFDGAETGEARGSRLHWLGHLDGLKPARRAREELDFQCRWLGADTGAVAAAVLRLGLEPLLDLEVRKLSAGQRRRLALGRLVGSPRALWLLDEPLGPLDAKWREVFADVMRRHLAADGLILAAVHDALPIPTRSLDLGGLA